MVESSLVGKAKYLFTGGKGGVGKTVVAASLAYDIAVNQGKETLLVSLNPVHSLSSVFDQNLGGGVVKQVTGATNLYSVEVEIDDLVQKYKESISKRLAEFFKWAEIPINPEPFIDIATTNPAFHESAMFDRVMDIIVAESQGYDAIVFDTAAVANAVRLIGLSKIYGLWLSRMIQSRKEALETRFKLSFRKDKVLEEIRKDSLIMDLLRLNEKFKKTRSVLTDPSETAFFFVTIPQSLPISVVKRFINMVRGFEIPVGGVVVNMILTKQAVEEDTTGYLRARLEEQRHYLDQIEQDMGGYVKGYIPLYAEDVVGAEAIERVVNDLYSFRPD